MKQRYDLILFNDHVSIDGCAVDGAVFTSPRCRHEFIDMFQFMPKSSISCKHLGATLSDVINYVLTYMKDPAKVLFYHSPTFKGSFKDYLSKIDDIECLYDKDNFIGIFMQRRMFD